jgi:disulfide bond formation protein DsbB
MTPPSFSLSPPGFVYSILLAIGMAIVVGTALGFQYIGGYIPCALCLYAAPALLLRHPDRHHWRSLRQSACRTGSAATFVLAGGMLMVVGAGMGVYHAGVEWHFWAGPATCSTTASSMTRMPAICSRELNTIKGPSCTDAALRVLGLSFCRLERHRRHPSRSLRLHRRAQDRLRSLTLIEN